MSKGIEVFNLSDEAEKRFKALLDSFEYLEEPEGVPDVDDDSDPDWVEKAMTAIPFSDLLVETKGLDTDPDPSPKPGARRLRHYWTRGPGAAKIGWGTPGDFLRCVAQVGKYVTEPEGLCNVYHRSALGTAPGKGPHGKADPVNTEAKSVLDRAMDVAGDFMETKVRYVRTPEGARRYGQPIGTPIVRDSISLNNIRILGQEGPTTTVAGPTPKGAKPKRFTVTRPPKGAKQWEARDTDGKTVATGKDEEDLYIALNDYVGKTKGPVGKPRDEDDVSADDGDDPTLARMDADGKPVVRKRPTRGEKPTTALIDEYDDPKTSDARADEITEILEKRAAAGDKDADSFFDDGDDEAPAPKDTPKSPAAEHEAAVAEFEAWAAKNPATDPDDDEFHAHWNDLMDDLTESRVSDADLKRLRARLNKVRDARIAKGDEVREAARAKEQKPRATGGRLKYGKERRNSLNPHGLNADQKKQYEDARKALNSELGYNSGNGMDRSQEQRIHAKDVAARNKIRRLEEDPTFPQAALDDLKAQYEKDGPQKRWDRQLERNKQREATRSIPKVDATPKTLPPGTRVVDRMSGEHGEVMGWSGSNVAVRWDNGGTHSAPGAYGDYGLEPAKKPGSLDLDKKPLAARENYEERFEKYKEAASNKTSRSSHQVALEIATKERMRKARADYLATLDEEDDVIAAGKRMREQLTGLRAWRDEQDAIMDAVNERVRQLRGGTPVKTGRVDVGDLNVGDLIDHDGMRGRVMSVDGNKVTTDNGVVRAAPDGKVSRVGHDDRFRATPAKPSRSAEKPDATDRTSAQIIKDWEAVREEINARPVRGRNAAERAAFISEKRRQLEQIDRRLQELRAKGSSSGPDDSTPPKASSEKYNSEMDEILEHVEKAWSDALRARTGTRFNAWRRRIFADRDKGLLTNAQAEAIFKAGEERYRRAFDARVRGKRAEGN